MSYLERDKVVAPTVRRETVTLPSLGADVIVRTRMLADRMALSTLQEHIKAKQAGESEEDAMVRVGSAVVAKTLALQVELQDGKPLYTAEEWALHGADHPNEVLALYEICQGMSGADQDALAKNSQPSPSGVSPSSSRSGWVARLRNLGRG